LAHNIDFEEGDQKTFISRRPDGLAFDKEKKSRVFLGYTRAMDTNEDWTTNKEQAKDDTYSAHLGFINHLSRREKSGWKATQINFTTRVRGSLHAKSISNQTRNTPSEEQNTREAIRNRTVQKTLSMSDMILKLFCIALTFKIQWTLQSLPRATETTNKSMEKYNLHLRATPSP